MGTITETEFAKLQEPEHGLVIVDTSMLSFVVPEVEATFLTRPADHYHPPRRWADGLFLLADNGFKVVFPQMVVHQSADMTARGVKLASYFTSKRDALKKIYVDPQGVISHVIEANHPNIGVEPPNAEATSDAARCMRMLNATIATNHGDNIRKTIIRITGMDKKNYAKMAALDMVKALPKGWSKPVFYLADDRNAIMEMQEARPDLTIVGVNHKGYLAALHDNRLFCRLDIDPGPLGPNPMQQIGDMLIENRNRLHGREEEEITRAFLDTSRRYTEPPDYVFKQTLAHVREVLPGRYRFVTAREAKLNAAAQPEALEPLSEGAQAKLNNAQELARQRRFAKFAPRGGSAGGLGQGGH